jgi:hypothetical protein
VTVDYMFMFQPNLTDMLDAAQYASPQKAVRA